MSDLAARMLRLRDEQRLEIDDAVIRQAAKDSIGSIESLDSRFRMAGLPQKNDVLRTLLKLRADAQKPVTPTAPGNGRPPSGSVGPPSSTGKSRTHQRVPHRWRGRSRSRSRPMSRLGRRRRGTECRRPTFRSRSRSFRVRCRQ